MTKIFIALFFACSVALASDPYPKNPAIDVIHYIFQIEVNDLTDVIAGKASITIQFKKAIEEFELDLYNQDSSGKGMEVKGVAWNGKQLSFTHRNNRLKILLPVPTKPGDEFLFVIEYKGIPKDGFIIGNNKYGDRGFFGDNWPNRGHHWLPVVDHPSDKSAVDFIIIAPLHYSVVANGIKLEESPIDHKRKLTHWHEEVPIPVKVMVAGIARFAVQFAGKVDDIPVESWVYPQNRLEGFDDYAVAVNVLDYFHNHIGPYPYKKLANVQSKTRWGGLENANAIFYSENSVTGLGSSEELIAHEEAHQWFGNSVSEKDWHHVWLSESFATYFAKLYLENTYGQECLDSLQKEDRVEVVAYYRKNATPIIDTTIMDINTVLNTNTYQKGGWVLHMLRQELGDPIFWKGVREYYSSFRNRNAITEDFQKIMEEVSGKDLSLFFKQWLYQPGHPKISGRWSYDNKTKSLVIDLLQSQKEGPFQFPLDLEWTEKDGAREIKTVRVTSKSNKFKIPTAVSPINLVLDPGTKLLFEGSISQK